MATMPRGRGCFWERRRVKALRSRHGNVALIVVGGGAAVALGAFLITQFLGRAEIASAEPAPGEAVATTAPTISLRLDNAERLHGLRVLVDGRALQGKVRGAGNTITVQPGKLREGRHVAEVSFRTRNVFARTVKRSWTFDVDVTRPTVAIARPARGTFVNRRAVPLSGKAEAGARVAVAWKTGKADTVASADGSWSVRGRFPEGTSVARVTATDRAGNSTAVLRQVAVDTVGPTLSVANLGTPLTETDAPLVTGTVGNDSPARLTFGVRINGRKLPALPGAEVTGIPEITPAVATDAPEGSLRVDGRSFEMGVGQLPQGRNRVVVWARDRAGNVTEKKMTVMVDSTEEFGAVAMVRGAKGADVTALQKRLKTAGKYRGKTTGRFDQKTYKALRRYQKGRGFTPTGTVGPRTLRAMVGRIVIDLSQFKLRLIRDGKVVKTYKVATGSSAYPTPTGKFEVVNKQTNPTWIPPSSPWAKGLGPIPPGPGNPLGTRWIGTSADAVGIHGTYAGYSVGTPASHGCLRMHIPEVEALFEEVSVGMPVIIKA
jgi:lipoprotein-anchoring transpeptidase ErfK/SrfK